MRPKRGLVLVVDVRISRSHAQFSLGDYEAAIQAYEAGLKLDPANANMKAALATAKTRWAEDESANPVAEREGAAGPGGGGGGGGMPDLSARAGRRGGRGGGGGAGGGAGGMPDLAGMMRNPQMMAMCVLSSFLPLFCLRSADTAQGAADDG